MPKQRHDFARRIRSAIGIPRTGCYLLYENQTIPGAGERDRVDLVFQKGATIFGVDLTIRLENDEDAFKEARMRK